MTLLRRSAFTLVELLVVIAIIGVLVAITIPAAMLVKEQANRATCLSNLKQIGLAMHAYHDAFAVLPTGTYGPLPGLRTPMYSSFVLLLPFLEEKTPANLVPDDFLSTDPDLGDCPSILQCPTNNAILDVNPTWDGSFRLTVASYLPCGGRWVWATKQWDGVFGPDRGAYLMQNEKPFTIPGGKMTPVSFGDITDGLSHTSAYSETAYRFRTNQGDGFCLLDPEPYQSQGSLAEQQRLLSQDVRTAMPFGIGYDSWSSTYYGQGFYYHMLPPNSPTWRRQLWPDDSPYHWSYLLYHEPWESMRPASSLHVGGASTLWCDGSASFVSQKIHPRVWLAAGTRAGGEEVNLD